MLLLYHVARPCARTEKEISLEKSTRMKIGPGLMRWDPFWSDFCIFPVCKLSGRLARLNDYQSNNFQRELHIVLTYFLHFK